MPQPVVNAFGREMSRLTTVPATDDELLVLDRSEDRVAPVTVATFRARTSQEYQLSGPPKVGGTAGWTVAGATNLYEATLPASQTGSKLIVPIRGLKVGWTITAFKVVLQIESAGNTVTIDADLRKLTNAAADPADASVGAITQVSAIADTAVAAEKTGLSEVVAATEWFYVEITGTTAASTDVRFLGIAVTVTES
jgi:hypothetical protein